MKNRENVMRNQFDKGGHMVNKTCHTPKTRITLASSYPSVPVKITFLSETKVFLTRTGCFYSICDLCNTPFNTSCPLTCNFWEIMSNFYANP